MLPGGAEVVHSPGREVTTDSVLLGLWSDPPEGGRVCELGCGSASVTVVAARRNPGRFWLGIDMDSSQLLLARSNLSAAGGVCAALLCCDVFRVPALLRAGWADLVMMNPPYGVSGRGRSSPDPSRELARRSGPLVLPAFVRAAAHLLRPRGRLVCVMDVRALPRLILACGAQGLSPGRLQPVGKPGEPASLALVEAHAGEEDLSLLPQAGAGELVSRLLSG